MRRLSSDDDGFTLIELLVVIIIVGILASIAIPTFRAQRSRAHNASMKTDLRNVAVFAETYYADSGRYTGFEASAFFVNYDRTMGVTLDVLSASSHDFCIEATHQAVDDVWYFDSDRSPQMQQTGC